MDLNTILIILGVAALIALVAHGLWSNRREKSKYFKNAGTFNRASTPASIQRHSTAFGTDTPSCAESPTATA